MSFTIETGDLFAHPAQALAHGVNCKGLAGAGVAGIMARKYPSAIRQYKDVVLNGGLSPGGAIITLDGVKWIIHCASQNRPGADARPDWLRSSLAHGLELAALQSIESVALPLIGGGIGGLDPALAVSIIREVAEESPIDVTLITLEKI